MYLADFFIQKTIKILVERKWYIHFVKIPYHRWCYSLSNKRA